MSAIFATGQSVRVLPPFGDGITVLEVVEVQHFDADGAFCPPPGAGVQYPLSDGRAYLAEFVAAAGI